MFLIFIQKVLDSAILNRHKIKSPSLPQLKKKYLFASRRTLGMEEKHSRKSADQYGGNINRDYISYRLNIYRPFSFIVNIKLSEVWVCGMDSTGSNTPRFMGIVDTVTGPRVPKISALS
jgi:hypothetical protein